MEKTHAELQREEIEAHKRGEFRYEPDPPYIEIDDPVEFEKGVAKQLRMNGWSAKEARMEAARIMSNPDTNMTPEELSKAKAEYESKYKKDVAKPNLAEADKKLKAKNSAVRIGKSITGKQVEIRISKTAYARWASKAKRAKLPVGKYLEKLVENR